MPVLFAGAGSCVPVSGTSPSGAYGRLLVWWTKRLSCLARFPHTSVNLGSVHVCNAETALKFAFLIITIQASSGIIIMHQFREPLLPQQILKPGVL